MLHIYQLILVTDGTGNGLYCMYRFWKTGYWRNHLQGRKYHISALYVVDLRKFRRIAAGDRLRGQYQALSQDPNSLSNLDQVGIIHWNVKSI
jgi:hypothetical protein